MLSLTSILAVVLATFAVAAVLVATQNWHGHFSMDSNFGVQKIHAHPTPRIGGIAIALGLLVGWFLSEGEPQKTLGLILLAGLPALLFGLAEDVTKQVGVWPRLLATMSSGVFAWYLTGVAMQKTGLPPLDWVLQFLPLAVLFTAYAVGGFANAINIIDGFNGLAVGASAIMFAIMGMVATKINDPHLAQICQIATWCAVGFALVNWPMGRIFLGDGGAYLLGFVLAWLAVLLPMRNEGITAWVTVMVCAYPVIEVGFSVRRKRSREGHHPGQPDRVHLHHLLHRRVACKLFPKASKPLQNGLTSPLCWVLIALPGAWAYTFHSRSVMLAIGFGLMVFAYAALYARLSQFRWCFSALTLKPISSHGLPAPKSAVGSTKNR